MYRDALSDLPLLLPDAEGRHIRHALHLYTIQVDPRRCGVTRDDFLERMNSSGVGTGVHYLSIPEHSYYQQRYGWHPEAWPAAMRIGRQTVSLPLSAKLTDGDVARVVQSTREALLR